MTETIYVRIPRLKDTYQHVRNGIGAFGIAVRQLEEAANVHERTVSHGYAGATAIKHLRLAVKEAEKARVQLESIIND